MIRPNLTGDIVRYSDPTLTSLADAEIVLVDSAASSRDIYPYAYTATVSDDYEEANYNLIEKTSKSAMKLVYGIFLSADNNKKNLLFNASVSVNAETVDSRVLIYPIFGRTTASTVTSTKAGTANVLDNYIILPHILSHCDTAAAIAMNMNTQILGLYKSTGEIWCLGVVIANVSGADRVLNLECSMQLTKHGTTTDVFKPDRI